MEALTQLIVDAWREVWGRIRGDWNEVERRLARRRSSTFGGVPRDWCLVLRAGDRRMNWETARMEPEWGAGKRARHRVVVTGELLVNLNRPVEFPTGGLEHKDAAKALGCDSDSLRCARATGKLATRYVRRLGGKRGKPVPIVMAKEALDPGRRGRQMGGAFWGRAWERVWSEWDFECRRGPAEGAPDGGRSWVRELMQFEQRVERVAVHRDRNDVRERSGKRYSYRVPAATDPLSRDVAAPKKKMKGRVRRAKQAVCGRGSLAFRGWSWRCPGCGRTARTLYYPVHAVFALNLLGDADPEEREVDGYQRPVGTMACAKCHGVKFWSAVHINAWNDLIMHVSAGLLYGREVKKPAWWKEERKVAYVPRINARPAVRRGEVMEGLLRGWSYKRIGKELGMKVRTVKAHAGVIYRRHRVKNRTELSRVCGSEHEQPMDRVMKRRAGVERLLLTEETFVEIAEELGVQLSRVASDSQWVYRKRGVEDREELKSLRGRRAGRSSKGVVDVVKCESEYGVRI